MKKNLFRKGFMVLLACMSLLFAYSVCAYAAENDVIKNDQSGIPDKGLYRAVQDALGKKRSQTFTEKEAASLKKLEIPFRYKIGIKSLKGIEYLSNLERLDISGYGLKSLKGIEKLPKLTSLVAEKNKLRNLNSIKKAKNLVGLYVGRNKLKNLEGIQELTNLEYLGVQDNGLTSLKELKNLKKLRGLEAYENKLTNLRGLQNLKDLRILDVSRNKLRSLKGIGSLREIRWLYLWENNLTSLEGLKHTKNLKSMDASRNQITSLPNMKKNQEMRFTGCNLNFNRLQEKEIRSKLPKRFFTKGKLRKEWLEELLHYQNIKEGMEFITPADGKITKDTTQIIGRVHRDSEVFLWNITKGVSMDPVKSDGNGVFVMDHLDFQEWSGDHIEFHYVGGLGDEFSLPKLTVLEK